MAKQSAGMLKGVHQKLEPQASPAFFVQGPSPFSRLMFFVALSIVLMAVDSQFNYLTKVRQLFISGLHPLEVIAQAPNTWSRNLRDYFTAHTHLVKENGQLKKAAIANKVQLQRLSSLEAENAHLRRLLNGNTVKRPHAIMGEILYMGRDPFSDIVVINRGKHDQIEAGQAVVDADGVIGQISRVYQFSSEVTLITNKNLSIPIQIERNQLRAIAFGEGQTNTLDIPYLPTSVDIRVGDKLVTSGIDGVYPTGLAVATVTQIKQNPDSPFAKIISTPIAGVNRHVQLMIIDKHTLPPMVEPEADQAEAQEGTE